MLSRPNRRTVVFGLLILFTLGMGAVATKEASASYLRGRHYYSGWSYQPRSSYYYSYYYYKPYSSYSGYKHHYCVYYPTRTRYVYYYNPVRRVYWGRYDLEEKGYSLLAEKDRKEKLDDIPEDAFPEPSKMPEIPDSEDGERMLPIDPDSLPVTKEPKDAPK